MSETNSVVVIYGSHDQAEQGVKELERSGYDMKKLSIAGKGYHSDEHVVGYYNAGDYSARLIPNFSGVAVPLEAARILWQR